MEKKFLKICLKLVKDNNPNLDDEKLDEIRYGLEGIYLTITKMIFIFTLALILGIFKEMLLLTLFFNILRTTGFGLHAKKSWMCWVSSTLIFIVLPAISKYIVIPFLFKVILGIVGIILIFLYTPADTEKKPLVNREKRKIWRLITTINCTILVIISLVIKSSTISNLIIAGIYIEVVLTNPLTYKMFNLKYNNYENYVLSNNA